LAQALAISRTTVVAAYGALRESGWVESRTGSGSWICATSRDVAAARASAHASELAANPVVTLQSHRMRELADVVDFSLGSPLPLRESFSMDLFSIPHDEYAALVHDRLHYPLGLPGARQAVATYYSNGGLGTTPEQVLITNGAQHAISLCAALYLQKGDTVLVEDPGFFGALDAFRLAGARISPLSVGPEGVDVKVLRDRIIATAARLVYLTPTYQNPVGAVMPAAARKEVARIASQLEVPIIDDGVLADLVLGDSPAPPPSIAAYGPLAPVLTIGSLSKLVFPGLRIGWIRAQEPVIERLARIRSSHDLGSSLLPQAILQRLLAGIDPIRVSRRRQLKVRRDLMAGLLRETLPEWEFRLPGGGLFLWVRLPNGDAREFAQVALRHGVILLPGTVMSASEQHASFVRIPFVAEESDLRTGVRRLATAWREYQKAGSSGRGPIVSLV